MRIESIGPLGRIGPSGRSAAYAGASPSAHPVGAAMTMRTNFTLKAFLAMLTALLGAGVFAMGALANTGGVAVASAPTGPKAVHKGAIATWFGPGFYGKRTACGQVMTPEIVGVANRTLPCGTLVKVSYHGLRLTLPVIDRGPYSHIGADWDLTTGAARTLGIEKVPPGRFAQASA